MILNWRESLPELREMSKSRVVLAYAEVLLEIAFIIFAIWGTSRLLLQESVRLDVQDVKNGIETGKIAMVCNCTSRGTEVRLETTPLFNVTEILEKDGIK